MLQCLRNIATWDNARRFFTRHLLAPSITQSWWSCIVCGRGSDWLVLAKNFICFLQQTVCNYIQLSTWTSANHEICTIIQTLVKSVFHISINVPLLRNVVHSKAITTLSAHFCTIPVHLSSSIEVTRSEYEMNIGEICVSIKHHCSKLSNILKQ